MSKLRWAWVVVAVGGCASEDATPVRATLADGQVLVGQVRTDALVLEGGMGELVIPLVDVGEVVPVEGSELEASGGYVTVWLRNGTELRGRWADPQLAMGVEVGGSELGVDLPVQDLTRFQLQGGEVWPDAPVFRVRTAWGDDLLVDPEASRLVLVNELGTFAPFLSECAAVVPGPDGWTVVLHTGTTLRGEVQGDALTLGLELGPEEVTVPLDAIASMTWEHWGPARDAILASTPAAAPTEAAAGDAPAREWFSNAELEQVKR